MFNTFKHLQTLNQTKRTSFCKPAFFFDANHGANEFASFWLRRETHAGVLSLYTISIQIMLLSTKNIKNFYFFCLFMIIAYNMLHNESVYNLKRVKRQLMKCTSKSLSNCWGCFSFDSSAF